MTTARRSISPAPASYLVRGGVNSRTVVRPKALPRVARVSELFNAAIVSLELANTTIANRMDVDEKHVRKLRAGEASLHVADAYRLPPSLAIATLEAVANDVRSNIPQCSRNPVEHAARVVELSSEIITAAIRGECCTRLYIRLSATAQEALAQNAGPSKG